VRFIRRSGFIDRAFFGGLIGFENVVGIAAIVMAFRLGGQILP
jgi:hypothetical protein